MFSMQIRCRALLFDMDGVLVDSTPAVARVWTAWANRFGLDPDQVVRQAHGRPSIATIRELLPSADHLAEDLAIQKAEIEDLWREAKEPPFCFDVAERLEREQDAPCARAREAGGGGDVGQRLFGVLRIERADHGEAARERLNI